VFYYRYNGLQLYRYLISSSEIDNADARTYGAEIESVFNLTDFLRLDVSGTWLDAKYTRFSSTDQSNLAAGLQNLAGNRLDRAPEYSVTVAPQLTLPVGGDTFDNLVLRADVRFSGDYYFRAFNEPRDRQAPFQMVNLTAALVSAKGLTLRGYVKNLTDVDVISHKFDSPILGTYFGNYLPPRTYGVEIGYNF
jgi:iron complex outermembrane recepter protein